MFQTLYRAAKAVRGGNPPGRLIARRLLPGLALAGVLVIAGCGKSDSDAGAAVQPQAPASDANAAPALPPDPVDLTRLTEAFANAGPVFQVYVDEAVAVLRTRAYADAVEQFQKLSRTPNLTPQQREAVQDVLLKLQPLAAGQRR